MSEGKELNHSQPPCPHVFISWFFFFLDLDDICLVHAWNISSAQYELTTTDTLNFIRSK